MKPEAPQYKWSDVKVKTATDSYENVQKGLSRLPAAGQRKAEENQQHLKGRIPPQVPGYHNLRSIVPPLNSERLKPIRQKTKNAVVSVLDTGEVCMEFLKEQNSQERVKEVL
ncbi:unnamed protein product, partial [Staurois parvus]